MTRDQRTRSLPARALALLTSMRTAAVLIAILGVLALTGALYPQDRLMTAEDLERLRRASPLIAAAGERLGLGAVYTSWYFLAVVALLAVCVAVCTVRRLVRVSRPPAAVPWGAASTRATRLVSVGEAVGDAVKAASRILSGVPWGVSTAAAERGEDGCVYFLRSGHVGFWGSIALHAALLVVIAGGIASAMTSFSGRMLITEGQTVSDSAAAYLTVREPRMGSAYTGSRITLRTLGMVYEGDTLSDVEAAYEVEDAAGSRTVTSRVNYPLESGGKSYLLGNAGYAIGLSIAALGETPTEAYFNLGERRKSGYSDRLELSEDLALNLYAVADADVRIGDEVARRYEVGEPKLHVAVTRGPKTVWRGVLSRGETATFEGYMVTFTGLRLWDELLVRGDKGRGIVYTGLWLAVIGMVVRMSDPDRSLLLTIALDGRTTVVARDRWGEGPSQRLADRAAETVGAVGSNEVEGR